jgi:thiol-disulfide isomerase/thioredoxin
MRSLINGQSGLTDPQAIQTEVQRVVALKRVAAERLIEHPGATEADRVIGQRGVLQALSHLASMGDWKAAEQLQSVAEQSRNSADADLRSDSQLVLIGFAIESLRHGKPAAAEQVSKLVRELLDGDAANGLARGDGSVDVATLMVLGQAKDTLLQYEHTDKAMEVRDLILERFGTAKDAEVARMAAMIAASGFSQTGSAIERLDQLRQRFVPTASSGSDSAEPVTLAAWQAAVADVLSSPADVLTVEFLAGVSLEAEAVRRPDIAQATYEILQSEFAHRSDALGRVARSALQAKESRRTVIGRQFEPDLPSVDGRPLSLEDYRGKLVLMPFWSSAFPDSLMVVPNLQAIQARYPDQVAIVGINVDVAGTDVEGFVQREQLGFPSFRSESQPGAEIVNEVAYRFGAVTLLFVAIIDHEGRVAHLDFSGEDLLEEVEKRLPAN